MICQNSWPHCVRDTRRSTACSSSASASTVSNEPRCRYRSSTSAGVNARCGQGREELLIDRSLTHFADGGTGGPSGMRCEEHAHDWPCRRKLDLPTIVEGATGPGFRVNSYLIRWELQALLMERVRHHDDLPKPGRRTRRVCWVHLDLDDRISHLPLLPFALVFSQEDTFLPFLLVFQGLLPPLPHSLRIPWAHTDTRAWSVSLSRS